jgi:hypothetical protein
MNEVGLLHLELRDADLLSSFGRCFLANRGLELIRLFLISEHFLALADCVFVDLAHNVAHDRCRHCMG